MATNRSGFRWEDRTLFNTLAAAEPKLHEYMAKATQYHSMRAETYMKNKAPWTDRTSNARSGLDTFAVTNDPGSYSIILYGKVPYMIWLETRWPKNGAGRYSIIMPTIREESPLFLETASKILSAIRG